MLDARAARLTLDLYGRRDQVRLAETVACAYAAPDRLLRVVAVEPIRGGRRRQAFYSTAMGATSDLFGKYVRCVAGRWQEPKSMDLTDTFGR
jgi:hypothetical protein